MDLISIFRSPGGEKRKRSLECGYGLLGREIVYYFINRIYYLELWR
jgi:hypothetical protein